jgi:hypothetical protein
MAEKIKEYRTAERIIQDMDIAYDDLDKGGPFSHFHMIIQNRKSELGLKLESLERQDRAIDYDTYGGIGLCALCPRCGGSAISNCGCQPWVRANMSKQAEIGVERDECRRQIQQFNKLKEERAEGWLAILQRVFQRDVTNEKVAQYYFLFKESYDRAMEEKLRLAKEKEAEKERKLDRYERAMDEAWEEYERRRLQYEELLNA